MNKVILFIALITSVNLIAQKNIDPNSDDIQKAEVLKLKFPDDKVAIETSNTVITFGYNKKHNKVTVNNKTIEKLINLDSRSDIQRYCFYDGESSIAKFKVKYKNNKSKYFDYSDEAYTIDGLFHEDTRVQYGHIDFPLKGYRHTVELEKNIKNIKYFTSIYFNDELPIEQKIVKIEIPNWLNIELKEINFEGHNIEKTIIENSKNNSKIYTYTAKNISASYKESRSPGPSHIYPHILILAKTFTQNDNEVSIFNSTQDLYNWYKSLVNSLTNTESPYSETVKELTENAESDEEKIKNIFYWVQDNIRYIAFEDGIAGFKPDEAYNVFNKKFGDCKGMANLTKQMLIEAGFDARLTWIGTKRIAYDYSMPSLSVDNHMICTVYNNDKTYFLDGTEEYNPINEYAERIQGRQVLIENNDKYILNNIPKNTASFNNETIEYNLNLNEDSIKGTVNKKYKGESRTNLIYNFNNVQTDKKEVLLERFLKNDDSNISIADIETTNLTDRESDIEISYSIDLKNKVSSFDNEVYIDLDFDKELSNLKLEERKTDYLFSYKMDIHSKTTLEIPQEYKIDYLPEGITKSTKNYDISVTYTEKDNVISYEKNFVLKNAVIETEDFEDWNKTINKLNNLYNEQITLIKK